MLAIHIYIGSAQHKHRGKGGTAYKSAFSSSVDSTAQQVAAHSSVATTTTQYVVVASKLTALWKVELPLPSRALASHCAVELFMF
jgi:hypothetical protein